MIYLIGETVKSYISEFIGTFGFVFIGCGCIVFATPFIGYLGISLSFGLAYSAMNMTFPGHHFNPALTIACAVSQQFYAKNIWLTLTKTLAYILIQIIAAYAAVALIYFIYSGKTGYVYQGPADVNLVERYTLSSAFYLETVLTFLFICVFLGCNANKGYQAIASGLTLAASFLLSYPVTKGALNPARTTASALFCKQEEALSQLPLFWGAALIAALIAGVAYHPAIRKIKDANAS